MGRLGCLAIFTICQGERLEYIFFSSKISFSSMAFNLELTSRPLSCEALIKDFFLHQDFLIFPQNLKKTFDDYSLFLRG